MKSLRLAFMGALFALSLVCISCARNSAFVLELAESPADSIPGGTAKALIGGQKTALRFWHFSPQQQASLASYFEREGDAALELIFRVKAGKKQAGTGIGRVGFLYEDDFAGRTRLRSSRQARAQVTADFIAAAGGEESAFALRLSMSRTGPLPTGFSVASGCRYSIESARIVRSCVGFDFSRPVPLYAFAPNGGQLIPGDRSFDLSGVPAAFPSENTAQTVMPVLTLLLAPGSDVYALVGSDRLTIRQDSRQEQALRAVPIPCAALKSPFSQFSVSQGSDQVLGALVTASSPDLLAVSPNHARAVLKPLPVDPGLIMEWRASSWRSRDYELFAWDRFPSVLIFDTASYAVQDDFFRRLAFFAEKAGYRGRLMSDSFLESQHGYNAHDYRAETLASFFELARKTSFPLNEREELLKEILSVNGIISFGPSGEVLPGKGAVISLSQESAMYLRWTFIAHEGWHGIFFTDDDFRNTVASLYYTMDQKALHALLTYFRVTPTLNYDLSDDYLMKNEFMAYMLQRPVSQAREYYMNLASRSHAQTKMKAEADYILETNADGFVSAATMLDQYVSDRWNLAAGRVWLVNRQTLAGRQD